MSIPVINTEGTTKRIKEHIQKAGRRKVAEACGVSMQAVFYWENGHNMPQIDNIVIIASICGCHVEDLLELDVVEFTQEGKRHGDL